MCSRTQSAEVGSRKLQIDRSTRYVFSSLFALLNFALSIKIILGALKNDQLQYQKFINWPHSEVANDRCLSYQR